MRLVIYLVKLLLFLFILIFGVVTISRKSKFIDGAKKGIPITFGYVPMGIGYAAIAIKAGMTPLQTISMSVLVYAGAGQFIAASMILSSASVLAIVLTNFVVNLRYFVMSTCVLNQIEDSNLPLNVLAAHTTVDESFAVFSLSEDSSIWVYLGIAVTAWLSWILGAAIGVVVLDLLPVIVTNSFNISLYALFVAILTPAIKENKQIAILVAITAVLNIILSQFLGNWSLIVSTLVGAAIGMYIVDDEYLLSGDA
ncbi:MULTISPECIES: AzlC family ABC transporter permease [Methanobrevibacter]|nr:AzlC family ABC transporter permease [Methanobrevibacter gottschalkii]